LDKIIKIVAIAAAEIIIILVAKGGE